MKTSTSPGLSRRQFLGGALAAAAVTSLSSFAADEPAAAPAPTPAPPPHYKRKIKLGVIGNGGRGAWLAKFFQAHGGYEIWAVADYFQEVADKCGDELGVDRARRFSTLSGYKRLIESGVEAVALETPPCFIPGHATAAVEAGLHVFMAKPVAVDVPGALMVEAAGRLATKKQQCFIVDYQMPTHPANIEAAARIRDGALGKLSRVMTVGICTPQKDIPRTATIESRLRELIWCNDVAMGCDYIGNFDIHTIDTALWVLGRRPVVASGASAITRPNCYGDSRDVCSLTFEYADGLIHQHIGQALNNNPITTALNVEFHGTEANALLGYGGKAVIRGGKKHFSAGGPGDLYAEGPKRNIARFYREIVEGPVANDIFQRAVDGALTCILGYEAAWRRTRLTMDALIKENKRMEVDLHGLKT